MKSIVFLFFTMLLLLSCNGNQQKNAAQENISSEEQHPVQNKTDSLIEEYTNNTWNFALDLPDNYKVYEGELAGGTPIINMYNPNTSLQPPFAIHEDFSVSYLAFLPQGFGVDAPGGKKMSFENWNGQLPLSFHIDKKESMVYLLENNEPWAYSLKFHVPPKNWQEFGMIFIHLKTTDFTAECITSTGETKPMDNCDPMGIHADTIKYYGNVAEKSSGTIHAIIQSLYFFDDEANRKPISELIEIEKPAPNSTISSPLIIKGKARGFWFFEGSAAFKLVDQNYQTVATGLIEAGENWMTEDWVPFKTEISFTAPHDKKGWLIFNKSNPSAKPEMGRQYSIPVSFQVAE